MKIGLPVAQFHGGNTSEYVQRAFQSLGQEAQILNPVEFAASLEAKSYDFFFCVDSGAPLNFLEGPLAKADLQRVAYWFIDFRHNRWRAERKPNDFETARVLQERGGLIFQAQLEDAEYCQSQGWQRVRWLPLAADPEIWSDQPAAPKEFHLGFVGNVWDSDRKQALELLLRLRGLRFGFPGAGQAWKEAGAALLRRCQAGFNINSFFGKAYSYDVNMRVFETLSCGVPLITNSVASLNKIIPSQSPFLYTYQSLAELPTVLQEALNKATFLNSGGAAREFILGHHTYRHRMAEVLQSL